tara:strand:+ start:936 stop:3137 length:2202 start_codon:yes stop_codon:yes gene_type:complete
MSNKKFLTLLAVMALSLNFTSVFADGHKSDENKVIDNITIIGDKNVPGSATVVSADELENFETLDVHKALATVPGINVRPEEGYGLRPNISIRGTYPDRSGKVTLMEDGILIAPAPYAASSAYYFPTFSRINSVEVVKGASAIETGPYTIGGAINMISTPIPDGSSGMVNLETGSDGNMKAHFHYGSSSNNFGWMIEGLQHDTDGFDDIEHTGGDSGFDKGDLLLKMRYNSDADADVYQQFDFKYQDSDEESDQTYVGLAEADYRSNPRFRYGFTDYDQMNNEHDQVVLSYNVRTGNSEFEATYYQNDFARDWFKTDKVYYGGVSKGINNVIDYANAGDALAISILRGTNTTAEKIKLKHNNRMYTSEGFVLKGSFDLGNHKVTVGYRDTEDDEDRFQWYEYTYWQSGTLTALESDAKDPGYGSNNRVTTAEASAFFISDEIDMGDLVVTLGIRNEDWKIVEERFVDSARTAVKTDSGYPKTKSDDSESVFGIGFTYDMGNGYSMIGGYHEGFTPTSGGADPESADNLEIGARYADNSSSFEVIYFNTDYANMFGECRASSSGVVEGCEIGDTFNAGESTISGLEVSYATGWESSAGSLMSAKMVYTHTDAEFDSTFDSSFWGNVDKGMNIPNVPETQIAVMLGADFQNGWEADLRALYYGSTCSVAACTANTNIDSNSMLDLSVKREINEKTDLYFMVVNLFDSEDIVARAPKNGIRTQRPRSYSLGVRYRF